MAHTFSPSTSEVEVGISLEFKASLVRTAGTDVQRDCLEKTKQLLSGFINGLSFAFSLPLISHFFFHVNLSTL